MIFDTLSGLADSDKITTKQNKPKREQNYVFFQIYQERFWWFRG